jgi:hypothetical protein
MRNSFSIVLLVMILVKTDGISEPESDRAQLWREFKVKPIS